MKNVEVSSFNFKVPGFMSANLPKKIPLDVNLQFLISLPGAFKIAHTVLGMICLTVIADYSQMYHPLNGSPLGLYCSKSAAYFLLVSYGFFLTSFLLLICSAFSYFTASFLPKTAFEFVYHLIACIMYLNSSLILMITVIDQNREMGKFKEPGYEAKIGISAVGLVNSILYGVSAYFSFKAQSV